MEDPAIFNPHTSERKFERMDAQGSELELYNTSDYAAQVRKPANTLFRSGGKKFRNAGRANRALVAQDPPRNTFRAPNHGCE